MTPYALRRWGCVHKWSSLICTALHAAAVHHRPAADLPPRDRRPAAQRGRGGRRSPAGTPLADLDRCSPMRWRSTIPVQVPHFLIWDRDDPNAMFVSVGKSHRRRPDEQPLRPDRCAYRRLSRCARRHRPLHLHHAQAARRHVRRPARQAVPRLDGHPVLRGDRLGHRGLRAVDAQAGFRHLSRPSARASCAGSTCTTSRASCW